MALQQDKLQLFALLFNFERLEKFHSWIRSAGDRLHKPAVALCAHKTLWQAVSGWRSPYCVQSTCVTYSEHDKTRRNDKVNEHMLFKDVWLAK
jgi:hypothetical protein